MSASVDFKAHLAKQLKFIQSSCRDFDSGNADEAIRIAVALRVIFHQTTKSTSLMTLLNAGPIGIFSSCTKMPDNCLAAYWPGLIQLVFEKDAERMLGKPKFDATPHSHRVIPRNAWWEGEVIFTNGTHRIKRKDLVLAAANKDGGAHVDDALPENYSALVEGKGFMIVHQFPGGNEKTICAMNVHLACLRQMAYEALRSRELVELAGLEMPQTN